MANSQTPPLFWEEHHSVGAIDLSPTGRILVSAAKREGHWFVRLRPERLVERAGGPQWAGTSHVLLLPPEAVPSLRDCLDAALNQIARRGT